MLTWLLSEFGNNQEETGKSSGNEYVEVTGIALLMRDQFSLSDNGIQWFFHPIFFSVLFVTFFKFCVYFGLWKTSFMEQLNYWTIDW